MGIAGLAGFAEGYAGSRNAMKDRERDERLMAQQDRMLSIAEKNPTAFGIGGAGGAVGGYGGGAGDSGQAVGFNMSAMPVEAGYIREGLIKRGMPEHTADGFLMNFQDESAFNTAAVGDGGNAFGLAQWNGPRKKALFDFAAANGKPPSDPDLQMDFLMSELGGPQAGAWKQIQAAPTAGEAGAAIVSLFERPAKAHETRRRAAYLGATGAVPFGKPVAAPDAAASVEPAVVGVTPKVAALAASRPVFANVDPGVLGFAVKDYEAKGGVLPPYAMGISG